MSRVPLSLNLGVGLKNVGDRLVHVNKETAVLKGTPLVSLTIFVTSCSHDTTTLVHHMTHLFLLVSSRHFARGH